MCDITFVTRLFYDDDNQNTITYKNKTVLLKKDHHVTRGPIPLQARDTFHNFAKVNFRDFLQTGTDAD